MLVLVKYILSPNPGIDRFKLNDGDGDMRTIPDLMRSRVYSSGRYFTIDTLELPRLYDTIEYDYRMREWFIVRNRLE